MSGRKQISFDEALQAAELILKRVDDGQLDDAAAGVLVADMVAEKAGARGFLVVLLTGDFAESDEPSAAILSALKSNADVVPELLAKNIVMSSTMALTHERNGDEANARGSLRVKERTARIIARMDDIPEMRACLEAMWRSVTEGGGLYADFLERWRYDEAQLERAQEALGEVRDVRRI